MYRLLRFIDNETNTAPDYEVVLELDKFEESDEILNKFIKVCKKRICRILMVTMIIW